MSNVHPRTLNALTRYEIFLMLTLALVQASHIVDFMIIMPLGTRLMRVFSLSPREFGWLVSIYSFTAGVVGFSATFLIDRFERKSTLLICYSGFAAATLLCAAAPSFTILLGARAMAGAFGGTINALVYTIVADALPLEKRGRGMGIIAAGFSLASVVGVPLGIAIANALDWHAPFAVLGGMAVLIGIIANAILPSMRGHISARVDHSVLGTLWRVFTSERQVLGLTLSATLLFAQFLIVPYIAPTMVANVGFRQDQLPFMYIIGGLLTILVSPWVGRMSDRYGRGNVFLIGALGSMAPILLISAMGVTPLWLALIVTSSFFVSSSARFVPAMAMVTAVTPPSERGGFMSLNSSLQSLSGAVATTTAGYLVSEGANGKMTGFHWAGVLSVIAVGLAIIIAQRLHKLLHQPNLASENKAA